MTMTSQRRATPAREAPRSSTTRHLMGRSLVAWFFKGSGIKMIRPKELE
jgi:hypothetical protein